MKTLQVDLGHRSYPIFIGKDLLGDQRLLEPYIHGEQVMVVTNETIAPLYLNTVMQSLTRYTCASVILPDGEEFKTLETMNLIITALLERHFNRRCTLVALGGGVVGDICGFAAACYQRGINFIQIPTTLLAQVDSSVGGKTGVNHKLGKNMIGAFHQPQSVIADTNTLNTLDDRQLSAGIAEVIKYGLICDAAFLDWLEMNMDTLLARDADILAYAIERSCQIKADIVAADEKEQGQRALLNLGHTFGHAIETGMGYGNWLHGEAVACGMCMAARMSERLGWLDDTAVQKIETLIARAGLPVRPPENMSSKDFMSLMSVDKKNVNNRLRLVLLRGIGESVITDDFDEQSLIDTLNSYTTG